MINITYSGVFTVNFEYISHLARREKRRKMCFILEKRKKSNFNILQIEVFFLPNIILPPLSIYKPHPTPPPHTLEYIPIKFVLCPYLHPGRINEILLYLSYFLFKQSFFCWVILITPLSPWIFMTDCYHHFIKKFLRHFQDKILKLEYKRQKLCCRTQ